MEEACSFLFETLKQSPTTALVDIQTADRSRDDSFSLSEVLAFLPEKKQASLAQLVKTAVLPSLNYFALMKKDVNTHHETCIQVATCITWQLIKDQKRGPVPEIRDLILSFHDVLLNLPCLGPSQNTIAQMCEWLWKVADPECYRALPQSLLYLLMRSFGDETYLVGGQSKTKRGRPSDVRRVYDMRKAFPEMELSPDQPSSRTIHNLLLRCATSPVYLGESEGRKFIAYVLTLEDIRDVMFDALIKQLATVRKTSAAMFGNVFLQAWTTNRSDWLVDRLIQVSDQAIRASCDPFASNLRTVMSSFHFNKRMNGIDLLLHRIYSPTLFGNLLVANPLVRRNAVTILADAFPIHDPGAMREDIDNAIEFQSSKLLELLMDPAPMVRCAAAQGVCRVLGMLWELVPSLKARKMIDIIITKLASDSSSASVRIAVFDGLRFLMDNHLTYPVLSVVLPQLRYHAWDNNEKVRICMLELLLKVKEKRLKSLRYFDIVPLDDLLVLLASSSHTVATMIVRLIVTSYFPIEKSGKTADEVVTLQIKVCLSMLEKCKQAARYFYQHVNLYVKPGPLCEFVVRLFASVLDASQEGLRIRNRNEQKKGRRKQAKKTAQQRRVEGNDENEPPSENNIDETGEKKNDSSNEDHETTFKEEVITIVADILVSIWPSLEKKKNAQLRNCVDRVFNSNTLKPHLVEKGNSARSRAAFWRIASCVSSTKIMPITTFWREQIDRVVDWPREMKDDDQAYKSLLSALILCAFRWKIVPRLLAVVSGWSECAGNGQRTGRVAVKAARKGRNPKSSVRNRRKIDLDDHSSGSKDSVLADRAGSLFALWAVGVILTDSDDDINHEEMHRAVVSMSRGDSDDDTISPPGRLFTCIRKGGMGAFDHMLENLGNGSSPANLPEYPLLLETIAVSLKGSLTFVIQREGQEDILPDLREAILWLAGDDLWTNLSQVDRYLSCSLIGVCMGPIADAAALRYFNKQDLLCIEKISKHMAVNLRCKDVRLLSHASADLLRLAIQLHEQSTHSVDDPASTIANPITSQDLQHTSAAVISNVLDLLCDGQTEEQQEAGETFKPSPLQEFISGMLLYLSKEESRSDLYELLRPHLQQQFGMNEEVERSFLVSTICNAVRVLAVSNNRARVEMSTRMFKFVCEAIETQSGESPKPLVTFVTYTLKSLVSYFNDEDALPSLDALEFFANMESTVNRVFPGENEVEDHSEELVEIRLMLSSLRNMREKDVRKSRD